MLGLGWLTTANREYDEIGGPDRENLGQLGRAVDEYVLGAAFQQQLLNSMKPTVVTQVAPPHTWSGQAVEGSRILYDNPDTVYRFMGVNMTSTYVIKGQFTGNLPADTNFSCSPGSPASPRTISVAGRSTLDPTARSRSPSAAIRPRPGSAIILQMTAEATLIAVRNTQSPMPLSIEQLSGPRDSLFSQLGGFAIQESKYIKVATTDPETSERVAPNVMRNPTRNAEFLATQLQSAGYFDLADGQALVVTVTPGNARYFTVPVTNLWTITDNYRDELTRLNNAQAVANPDGTYTFVISRPIPASTTGCRRWPEPGHHLDPVPGSRPGVLNDSDADVPAGAGIGSERGTTPIDDVRHRCPAHPAPGHPPSRVR